MFLKFTIYKLERILNNNPEFIIIKFINLNLKAL